MIIKFDQLPERYQKQITERMALDPPAKSKYRARKTTVNGITFDSKKEADRYVVLLDALAAGEITNLKLQHQFTLVEGFKTTHGEAVRPVKYVADFTYITKAGERFVIEDVKGIRTKEYLIKKKLMAEKGLTITEI